MATIILSLGSNLGSGKDNINKAYQLIEKHLGKITKQSDYITTRPWGFQSNNLFTNTCIEVKTIFLPMDCLQIINSIEYKLGRVRYNTVGYNDRVIDIDILFYDDMIIQTPKLIIPHPLLHLRDFVLIPLKQIEPNFIHPVLKVAIKDIKIGNQE